MKEVYVVTAKNRGSSYEWFVEASAYSTRELAEKGIERETGDDEGIDTEIHTLELVREERHDEIPRA